MTFEHLVRYEHEGQVNYWNLIRTDPEGFEVQKLQGSIEQGLKLTSEDPVLVKSVSYLSNQLQSLSGVGLNYQKHAKEANLTVPKYPVIFTKPADALACPFDAIKIHPNAQSMLDYEGELVVVIGKECKNVSEAAALEYVLGYTIVNDVSARNFQLPDVSKGQFCFAKSMDQFTPVAPATISPKLVPDPQKMMYVTKLNGEVVQETGTDDMIWSLRQIIAHLSKDTTLRKGTLIMTGTPSGVGDFRNKFLKDGDDGRVDGIRWYRQ